MSPRDQAASAELSTADSTEDRPAIRSCRSAVHNHGDGLDHAAHHSRAHNVQDIAVLDSLAAPAAASSRPAEMFL
ncbi:hypothetical protein ACLKOZ_15600 [Arthrobacter sp. R4]|uniref:hypothetical protein n=1 Tax=Arthrobacter sp. R4 TaxID=644417 RepID=UPI003ED85FF4